MMGNIQELQKSFRVRIVAVTTHIDEEIENLFMTRQNTCGVERGEEVDYYFLPAAYAAGSYKLNRV